MVDSRLVDQFEKMDAPQLRSLLTLLCDQKSFSLKVPGAKINIVAQKVCVWAQGIHYHKPGSPNYKDCENYKEGDDDDEVEVEDVPQKSKAEIDELVKSNKRKYPDYDPTMFKCEKCHEQFCIFNNPPNDCLWHPGQRTTDIDDVCWADHDVEKHGAIEDLIDDVDFEDRWIWSCCGELGSDWGCRCTRHKVLEEFEEFVDSSEDSSVDSSQDSSEEPEYVEGPPSKRAKH